MTQQVEKDTKRFTNIMRVIFSVREGEDIGCDECYEHIDQYVDMIRAGQDPDKVLPQIRDHLSQCVCCELEFRALITILEAGASDDIDSLDLPDNPMSGGC
jgi:hypothetical protein